MAQKLLSQEKSPSLGNIQRWLMLAVILIATFMAALDTFIVNVAAPSLTVNIRATFAEIQLIVAGYTLGYAVLLVTGGRLGDLYGRKRMFLLGVFGFTLSSICCGLAQTPVMLICFRVLRGALAALMTPQVMALIQTSFSAEERGIAFSAFSITIGLASILGQVVGGLLVTANVLGLGWRMIFLVNAPFGVVAMLAALPLIHEAQPASARRLDLGGAFGLFIALLLLIYPLVEGRNEGWPFWTFVCLILFLPSFVLFGYYEHWLTRRGGAPLVPLTLFRSRAFVAGILSILLNNLLFGGVLLVLAFYLQDGLHYLPVQSGLVIAVMGLSFLLASFASSSIVKRLGNRALSLGAALTALGYFFALLGIIWLVPLYGVVPLLIALVVAGVGNGVLMPPILNKTLEGIESHSVGSASGVFSTTQQVANALGVAVLGVIFAALVTGGASYVQAAGVAFLVITVVSMSLLWVVSLFPRTV